MALDRQQRLGRDVEAAPHLAVGIVSDQHSAGRRGGLHPGGDVDGVAHRGVLAARSAANRADDDEPRVDAHPHREAFDAALAGEPCGVKARLLHHVEAGAHRPLGVILMRDRHAEKGQERVAHQAGDNPFMLRNGGEQARRTRRS